MNEMDEPTLALDGTVLSEIKAAKKAKSGDGGSDSGSTRVPAPSEASPKSKASSVVSEKPIATAEPKKPEATPKAAAKASATGASPVAVPKSGAAAAEVTMPK